MRVMYVKLIELWSKTLFWCRMRIKAETNDLYRKYVLSQICNQVSFTKGP